MPGVRGSAVRVLTPANVTNSQTPVLSICKQASARCGYASAHIFFLCMTLTYPTPPRFVRHFTLLAIPPPSHQSITTILSSLAGGWLADFPADIRALSAPLVAASVEVYNRWASQWVGARGSQPANLAAACKARGQLYVRRTRCVHQAH